MAGSGTLLVEVLAELPIEVINAIIKEMEVFFPAGGAAGFIAPATAGMAPLNLPFVSPVANLPHNVYSDPGSGITVDVTPDASAITPYFEDPFTHERTINPAWVEHQRILHGESYPSVVNYIPPPDTDVKYSGPNNTPTWADVYEWARAQAKADRHAEFETQNVTGLQLEQAINSAMGTTIKAMSGFVNELADVQAWIAKATDLRIDAVQLALYNVTAKLSAAVGELKDVQELVLKWAIPSLQAQISAERRNRIAYTDHAIVELRENIFAHWVKPLQDELAAERVQRVQADQAIVQNTPSVVRSMIPELALAGAGAIAGVATRVATLEKEAAECGRPMCTMMGPHSDLGKALKAINTLALLALIAELASMSRDDVADAIRGIAKMGGGLIDHLETFLVGGEGHLGGTLESAG